MKRETRDRGGDRPRNCVTVSTREADGSGERREWASRRLAAFAKPGRATDAVAVKARGCRVVVVTPHQCGVISRAMKKTDEQDATGPAAVLATGLRPEGRLTAERAARGILLRKESLGSEKGWAAGRTAPVPELDRRELDSLGESRHVNARIQKRAGLLREPGPRLPGGENLTRIPGLGAVGASIRLAMIGDIADFPSEGTRAAYVGIVPRVHHAHATERRGPITTRGVTRGPGKAILALARTFLGSISKMLKHHGTVADFPRFVLVNG